MPIFRALPFAYLSVDAAGAADHDHRDHDQYCDAHADQPGRPSVQQVRQRIARELRDRRRVRAALPHVRAPGNTSARR